MPTKESHELPDAELEGAVALRREVVALRAELDRRALATAELLAVVRAVAAWEDGTGRADLLEALEDYDRELAGAGGQS